MIREAVLYSHKNKKVVYTYSLINSSFLEEKWTIISVSFDHDRVLVNLSKLSDPNYKLINVCSSLIGESKEEAFLLFVNSLLKEINRGLESVFKLSNRFLSKGFQEKIKNIILEIKEF